jgi:hypothetical protein
MPPGLRWPGYSRPRSMFGVKRRRQSGGTGGVPRANAITAQPGPIRRPPATDRQPEPSARITLRHGVTGRTQITLCRERVSLAPFTGHADVTKSRSRQMSGSSRRRGDDLSAARAATRCRRRRGPWGPDAEVGEPVAWGLLQWLPARGPVQGAECQPVPLTPPCGSGGPLRHYR